MAESRSRGRKAAAETARAPAPAPAPAPGAAAPAAARVAAPATVVPPGPSETGAVTYNPAPNEPQVASLFGKVFKAGLAIQIDNPAHFAKLKGNPLFSVGKPTPRAAPRPDPALEELAREQERLAREEAAAREDADEANTSLSAAERASAHLRNTVDALRDDDRDPPLTNRVPPGM